MMVVKTTTVKSAAMETSATTETSTAAEAAATAAAASRSWHNDLSFQFLCVYNLFSPQSDHRVLFRRAAGRDKACKY